MKAAAKTGGKAAAKATGKAAAKAGRKTGTEDRFGDAHEDVKRAWLCSEFLRFNTLPRTGADAPEAWVAELRSGKPMCLPGEILDLWIRYNIWRHGLQMQVGYMESYTLEKLRDSESKVETHRLLERLEKKFKDCSQLLLPMFAGGHWVLLQADKLKKQLKFADSLGGPVSDQVLKKTEEALAFWRRLPTWSWVPAEVPVRWNSVRQGPLQCGFFVATWLERVFLEVCEDD